MSSPEPKSDLARLNVIGFGLTVITLLVGLSTSITDSPALTGLTLAAQLGAMACFTLARRKR